MINWLPVAGAFIVVFGMLCFLAYCGASIDAEDAKVREAERRRVS